MIRNLAHAWRAIVRMPIVAAVVVVSLGVGIGVNTAVFSWLQAMVLQPIPGVADASRYQLVEPRAETDSYPGVSWLEYGDIGERVRTLPDLIAFRMVPFTVGESGTLEDRSQRGYYVSGRLMAGATGERAQADVHAQTMGIPLVAGTDFTDLSDRATPMQAIVNEAPSGVGCAASSRSDEAS